jgi:predicted O-linked N-acetylglucosamine transferase (SPINDLY family)
MGIEELIAHSPEECVALAVRVGTDHDYRQAVSRKIAQRNDVLFEDQEAVRGFEQFFEEALERNRIRNG